MAVRYAASTSSGPATASSSSRWLASGACRPVIRPVTPRAGRSGPRTRSVQPCGSVRDAVVVRRGLQRPGHGRSDGDHPPAGPAGAGRQPRGYLRHGEPLRIGRLVQLGAGDPRVQGQRHDRDAPGDEPHQQPVAEGPPGAGHLRAARLGRVDVLVRGQREAAVQVAVADGLPVPGQVGRRRGPGLRACAPEPGAPAAREGLHQGHPDPARQIQRRARLHAQVRAPSCRDGGPPPPSCRRPASSTRAAGRRRRPPAGRSRRPGTVADVFTTTRSPGSSRSGRSRNTVETVPVGRTASSRTSSRARPSPLRRRGGLGVGPGA